MSKCALLLSILLASVAANGQTVTYKLAATAHGGRGHDPTDPGVTPSAKIASVNGSDVDLSWKRIGPGEKPTVAVALLEIKDQGISAEVPAVLTLVSGNGKCTSQTSVGESSWTLTVPKTDISSNGKSFTVSAQYSLSASYSGIGRNLTCRFEFISGQTTVTAK